MCSRQGLIENFSTFLQFDGDRCSGWAIEPQLRRSMQVCLQQVPEAKNSEQFWVLYWHKQWQKQPDGLAGFHLLAYLQDACYFAAKRAQRYFTNTPYQVSDCFQIAIAAAHKILKGFDPKQSSSLKEYARVAFKSIVRDTLRSSQEIDICTDWALLRKLSKKRLGESLQNAGFLPDEIDRYQLAWTCFKTLYVPTQATGTRRLMKPDRATLNAIAQLYNRERIRLDSSPPEVMPETLEEWLQECAKCARAYLYPQKTSLNAPKSGQISGELQDDLSDSVNESLLTELIDREQQEDRQQQRGELNGILEAAIARLKPQNQRVLQLYYGQALTQQDIAQQLGLKQYQISRQLSRSREALLKALIQWGTATLQRSVSLDSLKETSETLEEWLQGYYYTLKDI